MLKKEDEVISLNDFILLSEMVSSLVSSVLEEMESRGMDPIDIEVLPEYDTDNNFIGFLIIRVTNRRNRQGEMLLLMKSVNGFISGYMSSRIPPDDSLGILIKDCLEIVFNENNESEDDNEFRLRLQGYKLSNGEVVEDDGCEDCECDGNCRHNKFLQELYSRTLYSDGVWN